MPILKDTEREQLRQLVKACLLEISKLKIELKKCQKESKDNRKLDNSAINEKNNEIQELKKTLEQKEKKIEQLTGVLDKKDTELEESKKIKVYFDALTERPKKDLTSFQSQVYQLLSFKKSTAEEMYGDITSIIFKELSLDNFNSILRNLERKGYFKSFEEDGEVFWQKIGK
ncbi:MAG: hypothetical protein HZC47_06850 [Methanobacterium sp.]|uniref:hypothetical protein n=1 Tax=Methanobacterium sp. TaxID=2164 RepID=UPI003D648141|nr:hypothetical protein [Methanobacterium sp.]